MDGRVICTSWWCNKSHWYRVSTIKVPDLFHPQYHNSRTISHDFESPLRVLAAGEDMESDSMEIWWTSNDLKWKWMKWITYRFFRCFFDGSYSEYDVVLKQQLAKKIRQNMFDSWRRYKHRWQGQAWISEFVPQVTCHQLQSSHTKPYTNILDINQNQFLQSVKWWLLKLLMH